jgi:hypothetical protein
VVGMKWSRRMRFLRADDKWSGSAQRPEWCAAAGLI